MTQTTKPQLLISATNSGCGKTTFTLGLLRLLRRRGLSVAGFKCGPDYIDPKFHELASGHPSLNLDLYMMSPGHLSDVYARHGMAADACIVEGVMGLFDGSRRMEGSPAAIAQELRIPTVLLVNAASTAYSIGALLYGYKHWKPEVEICGVVFNRVASESHYRFLSEAAEDAGVETLGYIPRHEGLSVPSRHLGLSLEELQGLEHFPDLVADLIEQHVDVDRLLSLASVPWRSDQERVGEGSQPGSTPMPEASRPRSGAKIAVARDEAFNFIYPENLRALELSGGLLTYFSPLRDPHLPEADMVYLPGGYPEFYLKTLSDNASMRQDIRAYAEAGGRVLAECGGMMYLCQSILDEDGTSHPMCGVLDNSATMQGMKLTLGYRRVVLSDEGQRGQARSEEERTLRGHEFHYSRLTTPGGEPLAAQQYNASGSPVGTALYRKGNVLAGYTHLYWGEEGDIIGKLFGDSPKG